MICGFLDPAGYFYRCNRFEHLDKAKEICETFKIKKVKPYDLWEDVLLKNGWICIRSCDVYKAIYDDSGEILFITEKQQEFFEKHRTEFNLNQLAYIENLLKDFGKLYKWHKEDNQ